MNLVNKYNSSLLIKLPLVSSFLHNFPNISNTRGYCIKPFEIAVGNAGNHHGYSCFTSTRRAKKYHRGQLILLNHTAQIPALAHRFLLTNKFLKISWPHPLGQRLIFIFMLFFLSSRCFGKQVKAHVHFIFLLWNQSLLCAVLPGQQHLHLL